MKKSRVKKQKSLIETGTIWQLGTHRLAYGDCCDHRLLECLIGSDKIKLIVADPPYGIKAVESKRGFSQLSKDKVIANDHAQSDAEYRAFTRNWLEPVAPHLVRKNAAYLFNADKMVWALREGMLDAGYTFGQLIVWVKSHAVIGRLDYAPQHELIVYGWRGVHRFRRSKDKSILFYPRPTKSKLHPTTKPIGLIRRLILNSSDIGDIVYDGFLGSGTTLLACEQTKRRCVAVEIDLEYCLTAIRQWERLTGQKARQL